MFGTKRRARAKEFQNARIRVMLDLDNQTLATMAFSENPDTADMAQAVIVVKWLAEQKLLPAFNKPEDK